MPSSHLRLVATAAVTLTLGTALTLAAVPATSAAGSCTGFRNQTGITSTSIRIGNASDASGPVPGLSSSARLATKAYAAYSNSVRTICGRRLVVDALDTKTDTAANRTAYEDICATDFAAVGSMSAFDGGGTTAVRSCGLPDFRAASATGARNSCSTCFGVDATRADEIANSIPDYFTAKYPTATQKSGYLYLNAGAWAERGKQQLKAEQQRGFTFAYSSGIDVADFSYGPYVQQLKSKGVQLVQFHGPYQQTVRLAQAMHEANYHPTVFLVSSSAYDPAFLTSGGDAVEGATVPINFLSLGSNQAELNRYRTWLKKISPKAVPTPAGLFAWSAAKLFTEQAVSLGGNLTRASLNSRLRSVTGWTGGGLHAPMAVGTKHVSPCSRTLKVKNGTWITVGGAAYRCAGVTTVD